MCQKDMTLSMSWSCAGVQAFDEYLLHDRLSLNFSFTLFLTLAADCYLLIDQVQLCNP